MFTQWECVTKYRPSRVVCRTDRDDLAPSRLCSSATSQNFIHAFSLAMLSAKQRCIHFKGLHSVCFDNTLLQVSQWQIWLTENFTSNWVPSFDLRNLHCLTRLIYVILDAAMELKTWEWGMHFGHGRLCVGRTACCIESWHTWMSSLELGERCYLMLVLLYQVLEGAESHQIRHITDGTTERQVSSISDEGTCFLLDVNKRRSPDLVKEPTVRTCWMQHPQY